MAKQADALLREGRRDDASAMARLAIGQAPLAAEPIRILALSTDNFSERARLMRQAGSLSQRDTVTQLWLMQDATSRGDMAGAAFHADMLLRRQGVSRSVGFQWVMSLLNTDPGRRAVAARLGLYPAWRSSFLREVGRYGVPDEVGSLLLQLRGTSATFKDGELDLFFNRLLAEGRYAEAGTYWLRLVNADTSSLVYDGQFEGRPGPPPLNWDIQKRASGQGALGVRDGAPAGMMRLRYDGIGVPAPLAYEVIFLTPGAYRIETRLGPFEPAAAGRFLLRIDCQGGSRLTDVPLGREGQITRAEFTVPPGCQAQKLAFVPIAGERRQDLVILVDSLIIRAAT